MASLSIPQRIAKASQPIREPFCYVCRVLFRKRKLDRPLTKQIEFRIAENSDYEFCSLKCSAHETISISLAGYDEVAFNSAKYSLGYPVAPIIFKRGSVLRFNVTHSSRKRNRVQLALFGYKTNF